MISFLVLRTAKQQTVKQSAASKPAVSAKKSATAKSDKAAVYDLWGADDTSMFVLTVVFLFNNTVILSLIVMCVCFAAYLKSLTRNQQIIQQRNRE